MTESRDPPCASQKAARAAQDSAKRDRLAAALRENLRRRKAQIHGRRASTEGRHPAGAGESQEGAIEGAADL